MANPIRVIRGFLDAQAELGEFIRSGPDDGLPGWVRDRYRDRCDQYGNLPQWARNLNPIGQASFGRFCKPYWDDGGFDGPTFGPPGDPSGRCAVNYIVTWPTQEAQTTNCSSGEVLNNGPFTYVSGPILGPLSNLQVEDIMGAACGTGLVGRRVTVVNGAGETVIVATRQTGFPGQVFVSLFQNSEPTVAREDGGPDNCAEDELQPGPNPPPNPGPLPGPEPTDNPNPDDPTPIIPIPPFDDPVYGPQPITGPSDDPPSSAPPGATSGGDGLPGDDDAIGPAAGEVDGGEDGQEVNFGPPPQGRVWVGCIVSLTVDSRIGSIPGTGPQSTVWPSVRGNVALKYSSLFGSSYRINSRNTEVFRPNTSLTVTGCFLQVQPGGSALVFPISALTCPENPCEVTNG